MSQTGAVKEDVRVLRSRVKLPEEAQMSSPEVSRPALVETGPDSSAGIAVPNRRWRARLRSRKGAQRLRCMAAHC